MTRKTKEESVEIKGRRTSKQSTKFFHTLHKTKEGGGSRPKSQQKRFRLPIKTEKKMFNSRKCSASPSLRGMYSMSPSPSARGSQPTPEAYDLSQAAARTASGRKTAGMHFPASGVRNIKDYISGSLFGGKTQGACFSASTHSRPSSPATKAEPARGLAAHLATGICRDHVRRFSNVEYTPDLYREDHSARNECPVSSPKLRRKCQTPDVVSSTQGFSFDNTPRRRPETVSPSHNQWASLTDGTYVYKRCQYMEAEIEYLRDREAELRERLCQTQSENALLSSELNRMKESWKEALTAKRKAEEAFAEQTQTIIRLRNAYSRKLEEIKELQTQLEADKEEWMSRLQKLRDEVDLHEKEHSRKEADLMDSESDISLNEFFGSCSSPSADFHQTTLSSSRNNSPVVSPRSLNDLRAENKRLVEENQRLKADHEQVQKTQQEFERRQKLDALKQEGNKRFQESKYEEALKCYTQAMSFAQDDARMLALLHSNKAATLINMERYLDAIVSSYCAISCDSSYLRAYQRRASAYESIGEISSALKDLQWIINSSCDSSALYREARGKIGELQRRYKRSPNADPYRVLGLRPTASTAEVKSHFRKLALQFHPDKTNNHEGGSEVFRLISQANSILSDEHKRRRFDTTRLNSSRFDLHKRA